MSTLLIRILILESIAALCTLSPNPTVRSAGADPLPPPQLPAGYVLVWADEFEDALNTNVWGHLQPGKLRGGRFANNSPDAVSIVDHELVIRTFTGAMNNCTPHYTGFIQSGLTTPTQACFYTPPELEPIPAGYMPRYGSMRQASASMGRLVCGIRFSCRRPMGGFLPPRSSIAGSRLT